MGLSSMDVLVDSAMNTQGSWISGRRAVPVMNRLHGLWSLGTVVGGLVAAQAAASGVSLRTHLLVASAAFFAVVVFVGRGLLTTDEYVTETDADAAALSDRRAGLAGGSRSYCSGWPADVRSRWR